MPKYVSGYSTCPDICLQPSRLEFLLDTKQPQSVLYHEESQIGINKQETQRRENPQCLLETGSCVKNRGIYFAVGQESNFPQ